MPHKPQFAHPTSARSSLIMLLLMVSGPYQTERRSAPVTPEMLQANGVAPQAPLPSEPALDKAPAPDKKPEDKGHEEAEQDQAAAKAVLDLTALDFDKLKPVHAGKDKRER